MVGGTRYRRRSAALTRTMGDVVLIAVRDRDGFERLDGTSSVAWQLLEEPATVPELTDDLASLYGVEPAEVASQVATMIEVFVGRGLVEAVHDG